MANESISARTGSPQLPSLDVMHESTPQLLAKPGQGSTAGKGAMQGCVLEVPSGPKSAPLGGFDTEVEEYFELHEASNEDVFQALSASRDTPASWQPVAADDEFFDCEPSAETGLHDPSPEPLPGPADHRGATTGTEVMQGIKDRQAQRAEHEKSNALGGVREETPQVTQPDTAGQRDRAETQTQQQQRSVTDQLYHWASTGLKAAMWVGDTINHGPDLLGRGLLQAGGSVMDGASKLVRSAPAPQPKAEQKTARQEGFDGIVALTAKLNHMDQVLDAQLAGKTGKPANSSTTLLTPAKQGMGDYMFNAWHTAGGYASAATSALGWASVSMAVPVVASTVAPIFGTVGGVLLQGAAYTGGAYLLSKTASGLPSDGNEKAIQGLEDGTQKSRQPLQQQLDTLKEQERARLRADDRIVLSGGSRGLQINALQAQLAEVRKALGTDALPGAVPPQRVSVTLGKGEETRKLVQEAQATRGLFSRLFSRVADFFLGRRRAASQELDQIAGKKDMFEALGQVADPGRLDSLEDSAEQRRMRTGQGKPDANALRQQLCQGENLAHALRASSQRNFGVAAFDGGALHGVHAVHATLTTARMLAVYLDALADLSPAQRAQHPDAPQVLRHDDGSLTVSDPGRKLHSFLMGAPTAYSPWMQGAGNMPSGAMVIDDHSPGMPGGKYGMQFEAGMEQSGDVLRLSFVPRSISQVFTPLASEKDALDRLRVALRGTDETAGPSPGALAKMSPEALRAREAQLELQLAPLLALHEADIAQREALENWRGPAPR